MNITLEKFNRGLLLVALGALLFRKGNFYNSFIPKPFELLFVAVGALTIVYILKDRRIKDFFLSIPKKVWVAIIGMIFFTLLGWFFGVYVRGIPSTMNMVLELGSFLVSAGTFVLVMFYARSEGTVTNYLWALMLPVLYLLFIFIPRLPEYLGMLQNGNFIGFTSNVNVVSKILLIPAIFFTARALFEREKSWLKITYIFISSGMVMLLFWIASRGAVLSLVFGLGIVFVVYSAHKFRWKKTLTSALMICTILVAGFVMTPYARKQVFLNRILNLDSQQAAPGTLQNKTITDIVKDSVKNGSSSRKTVIQPTATTIAPLPVGEVPAETRFEIWPFYLRYVLKNPLGIGPNTHLESHIVNRNGDYVSAGPHNTYLQIWLWGGIGAIVCFLLLIFLAARNAWQNLKMDFNANTFALLGILGTLSVAIMFDDSLSLYCYWIVIALCLRIRPSTT